MVRGRRKENAEREGNGERGNKERGLIILYLTIYNSWTGLWAGPVTNITSTWHISPLLPLIIPFTPSLIRLISRLSLLHRRAPNIDGKRSCRCLAGHNERRRKPSPGSLLSPPCGNLCPSIKTGGLVMDFSAYPKLTGRDSWPNFFVERGFGNQGQAAALPWQSNSQNPLSDLLQGTNPRPSSGPGVSLAHCSNGVVDSTGALSLLSNQPWASRTRSSGLGVNNSLGTDGSVIVHPSVNHGGAIGQFACSSWGFKDDQANSSLHEIPNDLGPGQSSHPTDSQYTGELGLAQPNDGRFQELDYPRGYDSSVQHMHWLL